MLYEIWAVTVDYSKWRNLYYLFLGYLGFVLNTGILF